jgi:hypothetical protein
MNQIKRLIILAIIILIVVGTISTQPAKAISFWSFSDNMENNPQATWSCWHENAADPNCQYFNNLAAHSGVIFAEVFDRYGGWSDIGRPVTIGSSGLFTCTATMYARSGSQSLTLPRTYFPASGQLEVLDYNSWTYISVKPFTVPAWDQLHYTYTQITTGSWNVRSGQKIFVRLGAFRPPAGVLQGIFADDLSISCVDV